MAKNTKMYDIINPAQINKLSDGLHLNRNGHLEINLSDVVQANQNFYADINIPPEYSSLVTFQPTIFFEGDIVTRDNEIPEVAARLYYDNDGDFDTLGTSWAGGSLFYSTSTTTGTEFYLDGKTHGKRWPMLLERDWIDPMPTFGRNLTWGPNETRYIFNFQVNNLTTFPYPINDAKIIIENIFVVYDDV